MSFDSDRQALTDSQDPLIAWVYLNPDIAAVAEGNATMTSKEDIHSDEYIAKLLAEDARKSSIKYSSEGLSALLPKR